LLALRFAECIVAETSDTVQTSCIEVGRGGLGLGQAVRFSSKLAIAAACGLLIVAAQPLPALSVASDASAAADENGARPSAENVKKELTSVIDAQLAAFRAGNYARAYTFATNEIRQIFPLIAFETMVKDGYPVIANSKNATYGLAFDTGSEAVINVRVEDGDKKSVEYQYVLKKEAGGWKISGVHEVKPDGLKV
jgi:ABC-type transporter MlaC component